MLCGVRMQATALKRVQDPAALRAGIGEKPARTLHLIDLENLMGGPHAGPAAIEGAVQAYAATVPVRPDDLVVVAVNPALAVGAYLAWPGRQVLVGAGPDGADLALLRTIGDRQWVRRRFQRVVIGSGDGVFAAAALELRLLRLTVGVVSRRGSLSRRLARSASFVRTIGEDLLPEVVA